MNNSSNSSIDDVYARLRAECLRRGYDPDIMLRLAARLNEMKGNTIPRKIKKSSWRNAKNKRKKAKKRKWKEIICVETQERFKKVKDAAISVGVAPTTISKVLTGSNNTAGGYHWRYVE